ncbi:hypothetical protein niasHT_006051 [Heterodera trifolii]|uniref:Uncharacterized protein n=1 Tax=Heterodera trifolii TaxID=157864 RepID=A0ABD2M0Z7_9BILA
MMAIAASATANNNNKITNNSLNNCCCCFFSYWLFTNVPVSSFTSPPEGHLWRGVPPSSIILRREVRRQRKGSGDKGTRRMKGGRGGQIGIGRDGMGWDAILHNCWAVLWLFHSLKMGAAEVTKVGL